MFINIAYDKDLTGLIKNVKQDNIDGKNRLGENLLKKYFDFVDRL